ncbi:hypothetical protein GGX14DRAFT_660858 [Mycena pura]|uniref:Uncharacterized protein n=1 Tax=Mycena pura TaxID=153505 RepID=A0AAD6V5B7_9AGAR|nr:hypothetical protein GGX14DRAFT_660858 [Mycena pura]
MTSLSTSKLLALLTLFFLQLEVHASPASSLPARKPFICPEHDIIRTHCIGPTDCLYPNPGSCTSYIHCVVNADGVTGTPFIRPCPDASISVSGQGQDEGRRCRVVCLYLLRRRNCRLPRPRPATVAADKI